MDGLCQNDWFMVAADFDAYAATQREVDLAGGTARLAGERNPQRCQCRMVLLRPTIREYANGIWKVPV